jgi:hypothetical protein
LPGRVRAIAPSAFCDLDDRLARRAPAWGERVVGLGQRPDHADEGLEAAVADAFVQATPTWLIVGETISGLQPESSFEFLARQAIEQTG